MQVLPVGGIYSAMEEEKRRAEEERLRKEMEEAAKKSGCCPQCGKIVSIKFSCCRGSNYAGPYPNPAWQIST